ncbi:MAG TPA: hypothetical protein EYP49_11250 [Anaerolineae bacterium]|nr:hypothetical protein [Anaerolineae bacterium]
MTRTIHRPALAYALLTFLSCFLELGLLLDAVAQGRPLWKLGSVLLAFHGANLLTCLLMTPRVARTLTLVLGMATLTVAPWSMLGTATGVFLAKLGIQWLRNDLKAQAQPGGRCKALPRLAGFIVAFLYSPIAFATLGVVTLGAYLLVSHGMTVYSRRQIAETTVVVGGQQTAANGSAEAHPKLTVEPSAVANVANSAGRGHEASGVRLRMYLTMATHSAHYFAFGYGIPALFAGRYGFPVAFLGLVYTAGWLGYYLIDRLLPPSPRYLAWGHLASALAILTLAFSPTHWPALLAWTITGFGGGTVFMLPRLRVSNPYDPAAMDLWDNGANIFGLLVFLLAQGWGMPEVGFLGAAFLSLLSAWAAAGLQGAMALRTGELLAD